MKKKIFTIISLLVANSLFAATNIAVVKDSITKDSVQEIHFTHPASTFSGTVSSGKFTNSVGSQSFTNTGFTLLFDSTLRENTGIYVHVEGVLSPDVTGYYVTNGTHNGEVAYNSLDGSNWIWFTHNPAQPQWFLSDVKSGGTYQWASPTGGSYLSIDEPIYGCSGIPSERLTSYIELQVNETDPVWSGVSNKYALTSTDVSWTNGRVTYVALASNIQDYINNALNGDTLILGSGTYTIPATNILLVNKSILLKGQGQVATKILSVSTTNELIYVSTNNVQISDLSIDFQGAANNKAALVCRNNVTNILLKNLTVLASGSNTKYGIFIRTCQDVIVDNCDVTMSLPGIGCYVYSDSTLATNAIIRINNSRFVGNASSGAGVTAFSGWDNNTSKRTTVNIYRSYFYGGYSGLSADVGIRCVSTTSTNMAVNAYNSNFAGDYWDVNFTGFVPFTLYNTTLRYGTISVSSFSSIFFGGIAYSSTSRATTMTIDGTAYASLFSGAFTGNLAQATNYPVYPGSTNVIISQTSSGTVVAVADQIATNAEGYIIGTNMNPAISNVHDLGTALLPYRALYVTDVHLAGETLYIGDETLKISNGTLQSSAPISIQQGTNAPIDYATEDWVLNLGYLTNEPLFTMWLGTNLYVKTELDPTFGIWLGTNLYVKTELDPSFTNWLGTNLYVKTEVDPAFGTWVGTNLYVKTELDPSFSSWLGTNLYVKTELDPVWGSESNLYYLASNPNNYIDTNGETDHVFGEWLGTNLYVKTEADPVWSGVSNLYYLASNPNGYTTTNRFMAADTVSATNIEIDAMAQAIVKLTLATNAIIQSPTNSEDGRKIEWRITASGANRTVTWPTNIFRIPTSSSMTNVIVVTNGTTSLFLTERDATNNRWLMESYIWGY